MLFLLVEKYLPWLEAHRLGFFRVFTRGQDPFRQVVAVLLSFLFVILTGPHLIGWLRGRKIGDAAGFDQAQLDELMKTKKGTPTMGGLLIIAAVVAVTAMLADLTNFHVLMALVCVVWLGAVGATDDWLKLHAARNHGGRQGLSSRQKLVLQVALGLLLSYFTYRHGASIDTTHTVYFPFFKNLTPRLGIVGFTILGTVVLTGSSNAVNLTDGLDGLAAGCMAIVSAGFFILALVAASPALASYLLLPSVPYVGDIALVAAAMTGACLGFLWFNCNPARVFMGDTGSLALGGLIGYVALVIRQEFMLLFIGGIFVVEAMSVMVQVGWFKYTRRRYGEGRRVLLCAPLHHHFQRKGWSETQVVVRFWLVGAMLAAMALATLKLR